MAWSKLSIIGVGLLGGSIGLAAKRARLAEKVAGYVRRPESIAECLDRAVVDEASCDLAQTVAGADLIILCTPLAQMRVLAEAMRPHVRKGALVTDVGSVKTSVVNELRPIISRADAVFIGSHPMAGAETMGVSAARPDLFEKAVTVITPDSRSPEKQVVQLEQFWRGLGCRTLLLSPEIHDRFVSVTSHLPHVLAAALVNQVLGGPEPGEQSALCATGFRDTTRIASGSPEMWRDIALANSQNISTALDMFIGRLTEFREALAKLDGAAITKYFELARERRERWRSQSSSATPE